MAQVKTDSISCSISGWLPSHFVADLEAVYPSPVNQVSEAFVAELEAVYRIAATKAQGMGTPSAEELSSLGQKLKEWRRYARDKLMKWCDTLRREDPDNPLLCPVSLFGTMNYGRLETAHTRTLAWLLDPTKEHGFGNELIEALLAHVETRLGEVAQRCPRAIQVESVESELSFKLRSSRQKGRIDVFAEGRWIDEDASWLLVIEAKIGAAEGEDQLAKIEDWIEDGADDSKVLRVFLTPNGRAAETGEDEWLALSFPEIASTFWSVSRSKKSFEI